MLYEAGVLKKLAYKKGVELGDIDQQRIYEIANIYRLFGLADKSNELLEDVVHAPHRFSDIFKKIFNLQVFLVFIGVIFTVFALAVYKQYILRKQNSDLEKIVDEKTKELLEQNKELVKQKELYDLVFEKASNGVSLIEVQGNTFIECNNRVVDMLNASSKDDILNVHPSNLSPEFQNDGQRSDVKADKMINLAIENGSHSFEWIHKKLTGEYFWAEITLTKIIIDGHQNVIYCTWKDIDEKKRMQEDLQESQKKLQLLNESLEDKIKDRTQELQHALGVKSSFLANMSHEIRTPLNGIMGFVDILYKDETDTNKQDKLKVIKESSDSLLIIINDILDFSKIESNKLLIEKVPLDIRRIFTNSAALFFDKAKEKGISIGLNIDESMPQQILGDETRVRQVFSNILSNAIKFAYDNTIVTVNVNNIKESNELYCEIIDSGIGIAEDKIDSIFNSFEQADSSVSRSFGGTGLGLSISKALIELMGGRIGIESQLSIGSKFYFTIPLLEVKKDALQKNNVATHEIKELKGNVLVAEDNKTNQMLMGILLKKLNLDYEIVNDGIEAVEAVKNNKYDLILMDENMPNMSGLEATKIIRTMECCKDIPIIAVTANALTGDKEIFLTGGMSDYLSKPVNADKLSAVLSRYL